MSYVKMLMSFTKHLVSEKMTSNFPYYNAIIYLKIMGMKIRANM
jgi:hypothetical protein